ncbi:unnamed protein product [Caenorhabditis auriculariae]|uniref:Uncharacterized protein n=1 Tax=Caenorhabditis auriculariae TaxID=2777116 RepID=A0A8S1HPG6_9PELO|nr:unnamed protein product [Caenorhabditis auriculariae]
MTFCRTVGDASPAAPSIPTMQNSGTAMAVRIIGGSFLSLSIVSSVIACALWNTENHSLTNNITYYCGLSLAQLLNVAIVYLMIRGISLQKPHYFQPFIICALFHLVICLLLSAIFFLYVVTRATFYSPSSDVVFFLVFAMLSMFWSMAISVVREYRDFVREISFAHAPLVDQEHFV